MPFDVFEPSADRKPHSAVEDFFRAVIHSAVEDPINGVAQVIDHAAGTHLPKLDIVDTPRDNVWSRVGNIVGASIDYLLLSKATSGLYDEMGLKNKVVGAGITGALFELTRPVAENPAQNFWAVKAKNSTAAFATFATMQAADQILESRTNFFGKPGSRTFIQDVALGGVSAAPGGLVDIEMHSLLDGKGLTTKNLGTSVASYALFGAVANGISHGAGEFSKNSDWLKNVQYDLLGKKVEPYKFSDEFRPDFDPDFQRARLRGARPSPARVKPTIGVNTDHDRAVAQN